MPGVKQYVAYSCRGKMTAEGAALARERVEMRRWPISKVAKQLKVARSTLSLLKKRNWQLAPERTDKQRPPPVSREKKKEMARRRKIVKDVSSVWIHSVGVRGPRGGMPKMQWHVRKCTTRRHYSDVVYHAMKKHYDLRTIGRDLRFCRLFYRKRPRTPRLMTDAPEKRIAYAKRYMGKVDKKKLLFADETIAALTDEGPIGEFRGLPGEPNSKPSPRETPGRYPTKQMVWGIIGYDGRRKLVWHPPKSSVTGAIYAKKCLEPNKAWIKESFFIQDGASSHVEAEGGRWCVKHGLENFNTHPPHSPDLNGIENIWSIIRSRVARRHPLELPEMRRMWEEEFAALSLLEIHAVFDSFDHRLLAVIAADGAITNGPYRPKAERAACERKKSAARREALESGGRA